jgi:hypothetical protein
MASQPMASTPAILRGSVICPVPAILVGALVGVRYGVPPSVFAVNVIAAILGSAFVLVRARSVDQRLRTTHISLVAIALLALSLFFPGMDGIHRWVSVGPVRLNISEVVTPWLLWTIGSMAEHPLKRIVLTASVSLIHVLEPDAGQATAFGLSAMVSFLGSRTDSRTARFLGCATALSGIVLAWCRPDRLAPVDHVERVMHLSFALGPVVAMATIVAVALLLAPFVWIAGPGSIRGQTSRTAVVFCVYAVAAIGVTELGNFPVPVIGAGASPVLGWYGMLGLVATSRSVGKNERDA